MKRETWLILPVALLFAGIGLYFSQKKHETSASSATANILFNQSLPDSAGKSQPLNQWKGKMLLVNFWATWCAPCVEEMPELVALQEHGQAKNLQVIGIGIDSPTNIREFADKYKISYPLYIAGLEGSELSRQMGNTAGGLPYTVLLDEKGQVKKTYVGRLKIDALKKDIGLSP